MRILIFNWKDIRNSDAGGAEVFTHEVARRWVEWGHDVTLFSRLFDGAPQREEIDGVHVVRRGGRSTVYRQARRWYQKEGVGRFDVVLDEVNTRPFLAQEFVEDVPVVALIYQLAAEIWTYEFPPPIALWGRYVLEPRWLGRYRDVPTLTISESSRDDLKAMGLRRVAVVPVGVSIPDAFVPAPKETHPTMIFVGRLARNKRPDHAIAAFDLVRRIVPSARLWMVGTGPLEPALRRSAPESVTFFGKVAQAKKFELMSRAHLLVVTSVREGWGLSVSEAGAVGTPAVGYGVPGLRDSIREYETGFLVNEIPVALAEACIRLLQHPELADELGAKAKKLARTLDWSITAEMVLAHVPPPVKRGNLPKSATKVPLNSGLPGIAADDQSYVKGLFGATRDKLLKKSSRRAKP